MRQWEEDPPPFEPLPPGWFGSGPGTSPVPPGLEPPPPLPPLAPPSGSGGGGGGSPEDDAARGLVGGYYHPTSGAWVSGEPRSSGGGGGEGGGGGFKMPEWAAPGYPDYESPGPFTPRRETFTYDPFKPSSWADAENEPGYQASRAQLRKQVEAGAAHRGMLRSGMALGDIYTNLDALSQQNFGQFDDRNFRNWSGNLTASRNKFLDEYGIDKDKYTFRASDYDRKNNYGFNVADARARDALQRWQEQVRSLTQLGRPV